MSVLCARSLRVRSARVPFHAPRREHREGVLAWLGRALALGMETLAGTGKHGMLDDDER